jgi:chondroitin 4-sulfotransferase 11
MMSRYGLADHLRHIHSLGVVILPFEELKIIYMKVPKTGGTSILSALRQKGYKRPTKFDRDRWLREITDDELEKYFIFSFVRNPWDRLLSVAKYFGFKPKSVLSGTRNNGKVSLSKNAKEHALPCSMFTHKDGKQFVDVVFRYEKLQEHFDLLCDRLGIERSKLPHLVKSRIDRDYKKHYKLGGRLDLGVRRVYKDDIELLGYRFEDKNED